MIAFLAALFAQAAQPAPPPPCAAAEAIRTNVTAIARDPERFLDRCVTVTGPYSATTMYSGREGMYLVHRYGADGNAVPANLLHRIGIDGADLRSLPLRYPQVTTVTGRVDSCERRYERIRAAGGIPFLGGYCHYHGGPTIIVESYALTGERVERLTGDAARRRFGNLVPMPADWPGRPAAEAIAARFFAALRAGDRATLRAMHNINDDTNVYYRSVLDMLLVEDGTAFAGLRRAAPAQVAFFVSADEHGRPFPNSGETEAAATICACRTADCGDLWPITSNDANNSLERPYACTRIVAGGHLDTPARYGWVIEPAGAGRNRSTR